MNEFTKSFKLIIAFAKEMYHGRNFRKHMNDAVKYATGHGISHSTAYAAALMIFSFPGDYGICND